MGFSGIMVYENYSLNTIMNKTITVGRDASNDKQLSYGVVSHRHCEIVIQDDGKIFIKDLASTNGTYINGRRITGKEQLKPGDKVVLANIPFDWERVIPEGPGPVSPPPGPGPDNGKKHWWLWAIVAVAAVVLVVGIVFGIVESKAIPSCFSVSAKNIYSNYQRSVVLIQSVYTYDVTYNGEPISEYLNGLTELDHVYYDSNSGLLKSGQHGGTGTGFFITDKGHILTNRHVVRPSLEEKESIEREIREMLVNARYNQLAQGFKVEYNNLSVSLSFNGVHLNDYRDMKPCTIYKVSEDDNVDLAIIQLNDKTTPAGINVVDVNKMSHNNKLSLGDELYSIGFPYSTLIGLTDLGIEANNQNGIVTQERDEFVYGNNISILPGASGSPVFDKHGRLCGVVVSGFVLSQGYNQAILPDVVDEFVSKNLKTVNIK